MKRVIISISVEDGADTNSLADLAEQVGADPTVWEWPDFWADVRDKVVSPAGDTTATDLPVDHDAGVRYLPWTDGWAVGFRAVHTDGREHYVYLNPSSGGDDEEHVANVFIYDGDAGDPSIDDPLSTHITLFEE